jgi:hypothetical protein
VKLLGGTMTVHSNVGHGTTFFVDIPMRLTAIAQNQPQKDVKIEMEPREEQKHCSGLLVDDHLVNQKLLGLSLSLLLKR